MRAIYAETLKDCFPCPAEEYEMKGQQTLWDAREIRETIDAAPTVDAVPVKHGKWNPHPFEKDWDVCSSCGIGCKRREREFDHLGQKSVTEYSYQYCPWCGAKMDGGRTDE